MIGMISCLPLRQEMDLYVPYLKGSIFILKLKNLDPMILIKNPEQILLVPSFILIQFSDNQKSS